MNENLYDQIIIGAGPAGLSAGIFSGQLGLKTLIIDKKGYGGQIKNAAEVVNYPGILKINGQSLSNIMRKQAEGFGVIFLQEEVKSIDFNSEAKKILTNAGEYEAISVILATGVKHRTLGFNGERKYKGNGVYYNTINNCGNFHGKDVFVAMEDMNAMREALFLAKLAKSVTILTSNPNFTCSKELAEKAMTNPKIRIWFNAEIKSLEGNFMPEKAVFINNSTGEKREYIINDSFYLFIFSGYIPQTQLFDGKINISQDGYILVNEKGETSISGVFAAGAVTLKEIHHITTSISDGTIASTYSARYVENKKEELGIIIEKEENFSHNICDEETIHIDMPSKFQIVNREESISEKTIEKFIDDKMATEIKQIFDGLEKQTHIVLIKENNHRFSMEMETILKELAILTKKIKLSIYTKGENEKLENILGTDMYPVIGFFDNEDSFKGVKYHAVPSGHEFNSFLLAILNIGKSSPEKIPNDILDRINTLYKPTKIQIGILISCDICPEVVQMAQFVAIKNKNIQVEFIDISIFEDFKNRYNILSVPAIVIDEKEVVFGKKTIDEFLDLLFKIE